VLVLRSLELSSDVMVYRLLGDLPSAYIISVCDVREVGVFGRIPALVDNRCKSEGEGEMATLGPEKCREGNDMGVDRERGAGMAREAHASGLGV